MLWDYFFYYSLQNDTSIPAGISYNTFLDQKTFCSGSLLHWSLQTDFFIFISVLSFSLYIFQLVFQVNWGGNIKGSAIILLLSKTDVKALI